MAPPTGDSEGGGPVGQSLSVDAMSERACIVVSSLHLVDIDRTSGRTQSPPAQTTTVYCRITFHHDLLLISVLILTTQTADGKDRVDL